MTKLSLFLLASVTIGALANPTLCGCTCACEGAFCGMLEGLATPSQCASIKQQHALVDGMSCKMHEADFNAVAAGFSMRLSGCTGWIGGTAPTGDQAFAALAAAEAHYHQLHADNHEHLEVNKDKLVSSLAGLDDAIEDVKKIATTDRAALKERLAKSSAGLVQALKQKAAEKQEQQRSAGMQKKAAEVLGQLPPSVQEKIAPALPKLVASAGKVDTDKLKQNGMKLFMLFKQKFKEQQQEEQQQPAPTSASPVDAATSGSTRRSLLRGARV